MWMNRDNKIIAIYIKISNYKTWEGAISIMDDYWCVNGKSLGGQWYHKQSLKIWDQTEWKQGSYINFYKDKQFQNIRGRFFNNG